jgi:hypothetical protein
MSRSFFYFPKIVRTFAQPKHLTAMKKILTGVALAIVASSCIYVTTNAYGVKGSGKTVHGEFHVNRHYHELDVSEGISVKFVPSLDGRGTISCDAALLKYISITEHAGEVVVEYRPHVSVQSPHAKTVITMPVSLSEDLFVDLSGASSLEGELSLRKLEVDMSGASSCRLAGTADRLEIDASGASYFCGFGLVCRSVEAEASGASRLEFTATESLEAEASGASTIEYKGLPGRVKRNSSGVSTIIAVP